MKVLALAVSLAALPALSLNSYAAGLGRITVQSALGQPLRAQLEITANRDELNSLQAKLASPDAFRLAGVEYAAALSTLKFSTAVKDDGSRKYVEVTTDRPLNEPFIDMLVELSWTTGRLVREYTFLLDPPELSAKAAPVAAPAVSEPATAPAAVVPAPAVATQKTAEAPVATPTPSAVAAKPASTKPVAAAPAAPVKAAADSQRTVKSGDTLGKIAQEVRPEGVSLDQMLVALFKENQDAFDGNMNRLRVGKILKVPEAQAIAAIDAGEARKEVVAQSKDFDAYRNRLAEKASQAPARESTAAQESKGKIAPKVEDAAPAAKAGSDKLAVSRSEAPKDGGKEAAANKAKLGALEEDLVARERALKEANGRIADLEKNLNDLKKLAEMKSQAGAAAQKAAEGAKPAEPVKAPEPKPVEAVKPATPEAAPAAPAPTPVPAAVPEAAKPVEAPAAPVVETNAPPPKPKKVIPPPEPEPEPDFLEENGTLVLGGGGLLAALLGYLGFSAYRRKKNAAAQSSEAPVTQASISANSVFNESASASLAEGTITDAGDASVIETTTEGSAATIDPLEEADTYLAFGKDSQAEEILLEALRADPARLAVHLKLLEIYAGRRSTMQFNTLAEDLRQQTGGNGAEWDRAVEMGRSLDPNNPLYQEVVVEETVSAAAEPDTEATMVFSAPPALEASAVAEPVAVAPAEDDGVVLDFDLGLDEPAVPAETVSEASAESAAESSEVAALDFDLDLGSPAQSVELAAEVAEVAETAVEESVAPAETAEASLPPMDIDFDLELPETPKEEAVALALDMDLDLPETPAAVELAPLPAVEEALSLDVNDVAGNEVSLQLDELKAVDISETTATVDAAPALDFDFDLGDAPAVTVAEEPGAAPTLDIDLDMPSLELDAPAAVSLDVAVATPVAAPAMELAGEDIPDNPEAATKLELALAYEEMGDRDGARELFEEVVKEGSPSQQAAARDKLGQLA